MPNKKELHQIIQLFFYKYHIQAITPPHTDNSQA